MLHVTPIYAGLLGLLFFVLSVRVIRGRGMARVSLGDGGHRELGRRIRVHANFAEYVPLCLVLMGVAEGQGLGAGWLHGFGAALLAGRIAHALGLGTKGPAGNLRTAGTALTFFVLIGLSVAVIARALGGM